MWHLDRIKLEHFQSHLLTEYSFKNHATTMVYGVNYDDPEGADSNGSGKSVLIRGITVALLGIPNRDLGKEDYIMDGYDETVVTLQLTNQAYNLSLDIERTIYRSSNKGAECILIENGKPNKEVLSNDDATAKILKWLDINKEDLLNYYMINQDNSHSFFQASDNDKKQIIARFTNTDLLDIITQEVEADIKIAEHEILGKEATVKVLTTRIESFEEQKIYEETQRKADNEELIDGYRQQYKDIEHEILTLKDTKNTRVDTLAVVSAKLATFTKKIDQKVLENQIKTAKLALETSRKEREEADELLSEINRILRGEVTCPKCHHHFSIEDEEVDVVALVKERDTLLETIGDIRKAIEEAKKLYENKWEDLERSKDRDQNFNRVSQNIENIKEDIEDIDKKIDRKKNDLGALQNKIDELQNFALNSKRIKELDQNISETRSRVQSSLKEIDDLSNNLNEIKFWQIHFSELGLKTFLINKVLTNLEGHINNTLQRFKINLIVKINGFTVTKSKKVKETIDVLISKDGGKNWKVYKRFSGGQRARVNVSGILTIHQLINESSKYGGLNFLGLDEYFEGLDQKGQKAILPILEASGITCLVISHVNNNIGALNELYIEYENEISTIRK